MLFRRKNYAFGITNSINCIWDFTAHEYEESGYFCLTLKLPHLFFMRNQQPCNIALRKRHVVRVVVIARVVTRPRLVSYVLVVVCVVKLVPDHSGLYPGY